MTELLEIELRPRRASDTDLILSDWIRSYRAFGLLCRGVPNLQYHAKQKPLVMAALGRCTTVVACCSDEPELVYGWACYERGPQSDVLHYVHVKERYRQYRVASRLLAELSTPVSYTHRTEQTRDLWKLGKIPKGWEYDPYLWFEAR
jgi:hypothetical protein